MLKAGQHSLRGFVLMKGIHKVVAPITVNVKERRPSAFEAKTQLLDDSATRLILRAHRDLDPVQTQH